MKSKTDSARVGLYRLVRCVMALGLRLGWRYWRIESRALVNPWIVLDWADACEREADELDAKREGLLALQYRAWATELRSSYARFMSSPNIAGLPRAGNAAKTTPST